MKERTHIIVFRSWHPYSLAQEWVYVTGYCWLPQSSDPEGALGTSETSWHLCRIHGVTAQNAINMMATFMTISKLRGLVVVSLYKRRKQSSNKKNKKQLKHSCMASCSSN